MILPPPPPARKPESVVDTECYSDYWLCMFDSGETFEMWPGQPLDINGLARALQKHTIITFNGNNYDVPLMCLALQGATTYDLKQASDRIILENLRGWQVAKVFDWIDHVDLFDVAPGMGSLKMYGGKMHSQRLQDLPIDPATSISPAQREELKRYCANDLRTTRDLFVSMQSQIALRQDMSREYGIDLRSKSDAQMAEAVMKKLLPFKVEIPYVAPGTQFYYRPPSWLKFQSLDLVEQLAQLPFAVNLKGGVSPPYHANFIDWGDDQVRLDPHGSFVKRPPGWAASHVTIGQGHYTVGIGGLHSNESKIAHVARDGYTISDHDVASYYPSLILQTGIYPQQIGPQFAQIYRGWYERRLAAKAAGDKKNANSLKTLLNGTFGKLGSQYSIFYAPSEMIQVTIGGQLCLLMLIEMLELSGIQVISANTDGIVVKCHQALHPLRDDIIRWWESTTGLVTEQADYRLLASRDVNSYVAITLDGKAKLKGAFAPPEPGPSGWPNPTGQISVDAVVAYLQHGTPLEDTIRACTDIRQFLHVRQVKGGGSYCPNGNLSLRETQIFMRSVVGDIKDKTELLMAYSRACDANHAQRQYLGKAVRWYYAKGSKGCIVTPTGGLVARTDGCKPMMELTAVIPPDIDYDWYITEARGLLKDIGL